MEYVISIAKRYNHARTHYRDPRNRGIKGAKRVPITQGLTIEILAIAV